METKTINGNPIECVKSIQDMDLQPADLLWVKLTLAEMIQSLPVTMTISDTEIDIVGTCMEKDKKSLKKSSDFFQVLSNGDLPNTTKVRAQKLFNLGKQKMSNQETSATSTTTIEVMTVDENGTETMIHPKPITPAAPTLKEKVAAALNGETPAGEWPFKTEEVKPAVLAAKPVEEKFFDTTTGKVVKYGTIALVVAAAGYAAYTYFGGPAITGGGDAPAE